MRVGGRKTVIGAAASAAAFRLTAGSLGTLGGITGLYVDGVNIREEKSAIIKGLLVLRWTTSLAH